MPVVCLWRTCISQSDNNMNKDLTHGKIWVFYSFVVISMYNNHFSNQNKFKILTLLFQPLCSLPLHIGCYFKVFSLKVSVYYLGLWLNHAATSWFIHVVIQVYCLLWRPRSFFFQFWEPTRVKTSKTTIVQILSRKN